MARSGKGSRFSKASRKASASLHGSETTKLKPVVAPSRVNHARSGKSSALDRTVFGTRLTWRAVLLFMLVCILLDVALWAVFKFGFGSCYAVLCLFG